MTTRAVRPHPPAPGQPAVAAERLARSVDRAGEGGHREALRLTRPDLRAPREAREFSARVLRSWGVDGALIENARLITSELVTNAVLHCPRTGGIVVLVTLARSRAVITVIDPGPWREAVSPGAAGPGDEWGRGLPLVAALADEWAPYPHIRRTAVYAALRLDRPAC
ncbi:ATP-binding protein [Streptomyces sp. NPDC088732]|uniref:ATP-binding protein n=1 Tax=Streptomyces sp. NPDC088732 TaxID=3365879 RepID=UPI0038163F36